MNDNVRFSQNFLRNPKLVTNLLAKTNINATDTVYDIGGGKGIITAALAERCRMVISVEIDPRLADKLRRNLRNHSNVTIYEADFLLLSLPQTPYKVFSNIPFNLSADILRKLVDTPQPPSASYLIVQKEFADKLVSKPGGYHSQLSILLGVQFEMRIVQRLQPDNFYPRPKVAAVLLEVLPRIEALLPAAHIALFRDFVSYSYNSWQPNVATSLSRLFTAAEFEHIARALNCPSSVSPAQLDLQQWLGVFSSAMQKRPLLEKLVVGYEKKLTQLHARRTVEHRTRSNRR